MILNADARRIPLADESVHACVTSPPYLGLRDYGLDSGIGLEQTLDEYLAAISTAFAEVWRVLRPDGTLWLNLGDCYSGSRKGEGGHGILSAKQNTNRASRFAEERWGGELRAFDFGLRPKNLVGVPWRVAFALQEAGWNLRSDIIWHKPNPMPGSQLDRPTTAHEYVFLFSKSRHYYYDHVAIQEPALTGAWDAMPPIGGEKHADGDNGHRTYSGNTPASAGFRNKRDVWTIPTAAFRGDHFAAFPEALVEPCILAGTSAAGVCQQCGRPWKRVVERVDTGQTQKAPDGRATYPGRHGHIHRGGREKGATAIAVKSYATTGWEPTCECGTDRVEPAVVLDPFCGSGTTGKVCRQFNRHFVGLDLSMKYLRDLAYPRAETGQLAFGGLHE